MTDDELVDATAEAIQNAYNQGDEAAVNQAFRSADQALSNRRFDRKDRERFWREVGPKLHSKQELFKYQNNAALADLMKLIEEALAARS